MASPSSSDLTRQFTSSGTYQDRTLRGQIHTTGLSTNKLEVVFLSQTAPLATVNMLLKAALPVIQALATFQAQDSAPSVPETLDTASPPQKPKSFKSITSHLC